MFQTISDTSSLKFLLKVFHLNIAISMSLCPCFTFFRNSRKFPLTPVRTKPCLFVNFKSSLTVLPAISMVRTNRCTGKADGLYVVSDVFQYLECKTGAEIMHACPDNTIFVAKKMNCSAVTTADEGNDIWQWSYCQMKNIIVTYKVKISITDGAKHAQVSSSRFLTYRSASIRKI